MRALWWIGSIVACGLLAAAAIGWALVRGGAYDVAATTPHWQATYSLLDAAMRHSVQRRARQSAPPASAADSAATLARGGACFREHCVLCHGAPGVAPAALALALQPLPGPLAEAGRRWSEAELYWLTRHGIRMSGMPAWEHRLADADLWAVARFVAHLPQLTPREYAALQARSPQLHCPTRASTPAATPVAAPAMTPPPPSAERGRAALRQYGCRGCHVIDGIVGPAVTGGPSLDGIARRPLIAARLPNTADDMVRWIEDPQRWKPGTAMPALGVASVDARDMAAYLATLR